MNNTQRAYTFTFVDINDAAPREIHEGGTVVAEDTVHAGLLALDDLKAQGIEASVFAVKQVSWESQELFGMTHLMLPMRFRTACLAQMNPSNVSTEIFNIAEEISCDSCLEFARTMEIPTA